MVFKNPRNPKLNAGNVQPHCGLMVESAPWRNKDWGQGLLINCFILISALDQIFDMLPGSVSRRMIATRSNKILHFITFHIEQFSLN